MRLVAAMLDGGVTDHFCPLKTMGSAMAYDVERVMGFEWTVTGRFVYNVLNGFEMGKRRAERKLLQ